MNTPLSNPQSAIRNPQFLSILVVEDNPADADFIHELLPETGPVSFQIESVSRLAGALTRLERPGIDLVLLDLVLPDSQGLATLHQLRAAAPELPVIVLTGTDDSELGTAAVRAGAQDYLVKGQVSGSLLARAARYALERQKTEQTLRLSEARYRQIVETAHEGIWCIDADSRGSFVNQRMAAMLGYPAGEMLGRLLTDFLRPEDAADHALQFQARQHGQPGHFERRYHHANGEWRWMSVSATPQVDAAGRFLGSFAMFTDITERKQAEEALRQSEEQFRAMFELASIGMAQADVQTGQFMRVNQALCAITGYSAEEMLRLRVHEVTHPDDRQNDWDKFQRVVRGEALDYHLEKRYVRKDGSVSWVNVNMTVIRDAAGQPRRTMATIEDITERKQMEQHLRDSEALYQSLVENLPQHVFRKDRAGRFTFGNELFCASLGQPLAEILGQTDLDFCPPALAEKYRRDDQRVIETGQPFEDEEEHRQASGETIFVRVIKTPLRDAAGQIIGVQGISWDITEHRQVQETLRESEDRFRSAMEYSAIGMALVAPDGRWLDVNRSVCRMIGYSREELLATSFQVITHPDDLNADLDQVRRMLEREIESYQMEKRYLHKNGGVVWALLSVSLVWRSDGSPRYFISQIEDITARRQAEEQLRESEDRYRSLVEESPDAIGIYQDGGLVFVNATGVKLLGAKTKEELLGRKSEQIIHPDHLPDAKDRLRRRLAGETGMYPVEVRYVRLDGAIVPVEVAATPITFGGNPAVQFIARDTTERKRTEAALRESELRFRSLVTHAPIGIYETDAHGGCVFVNERWSQISGLLPAEARGDGWVQAISPDDRAGVFAEWNRAAASANPFDLQYRFRTPEGVVTWVHGLASAVRNEGGEIVSYFGTITDISERKQAEAELQRHHELYRRAITAANAIPYQKDYESDTYVFLGEGIKDLTGYAPSELCRTVWKEMILETEFLGEAAGLPMAEVARRVMAGQLKHWRADHRLRTRSGEIRWISDASISLFDTDGKYSGSLGILQDISERKQAEAIRETLLSLTTRLSEVQTPVEVARTIFAVADRLWQWDAGVLDAFVPGEDLMETVLCCDIVEGERREMPLTETRREPTPRTRRVMVQGRELILRAPHELQVSDSVVFGDTARLSASIICVPIRRQGQPVGVLSVQSYTPDAFTPEDLQTLQGLADHCGGALERLRAEEALRKSEADYHVVIRTTHDGFWMLDAQGRLLDVNEAYCHLTGYRREQLLAMRISDVEAVESPEDVQRHLEQLMATGSDRFETRHRCADGRLVELEVSSNYMPGSGGQIFAFFRDITERKRAAAAQARLAAAVEHAGETILITSPEGTILYANPVFEKTSGYTRQEAVGQNPRLLKSGKHAAEFYRQMWTALTAGQVWTGHLINRRKNGTLYEEDASISPVLDAAGQIVNYVAVKRDVTEQKKLEAQFLRAQRMESVGRLAGGIAHDLNNILAPILMGASLLQEGLSPEEAGPLIDTIASSAQRGADIVNQLLTFARGTEGQKVPLPPSRLIKEMARIVRETFPKSITLRAEFAKDLWLVLGDPTQLHQVLLNLCVNARDAMPEGGTLTLAAENVTFDDCYAEMNPEAKAGPYVVVRVSDTGTGIPQAIMDQIFDPFFTTKGPETGTGLGLATVQSIVKSHAGFIHVESQEGRGSCFRFYLPAQPQAETAAAATPVRDLPRGNGELVLVVDDEPNIREITGRILEQHGYRVLTANDGAGAVGLYAQHQAEIRVVLTDMMMPVMDGPATVRVLRGMNPQVRIIAASGASSKVRLAEIAALSVQAYLPKPFTTERLLVTLQAVLHGDGKRWEAH